MKHLKKIVVINILCLSTIISACGSKAPVRKNTANTEVLSSVTNVDEYVKQIQAYVTTGNNENLDLIEDSCILFDDEIVADFTVEQKYVSRGAIYVTNNNIMYRCQLDINGHIQSIIKYDLEA